MFRISSIYKTNVLKTECFETVTKPLNMSHSNSLHEHTYHGIRAWSLVRQVGCIQSRLTTATKNGVEVFGFYVLK